MRTFILLGVFSFLGMITIVSPSAFAGLPDCWSAFEPQLPTQVAQEVPLSLDQINYVTFGDKRNPALVLIHGQDSAWQTFTPVIQPLAAEYFVIAVDLRGHGGSAAHGFNFTSSLLSRDIYGLLEGLEVRKAHLLGHSFGAKAVLRLAADHPELALSVAIEDMEIQQKLSGPLDKYIEQAQALRIAIPETFASKDDLVSALEAYLYSQIPEPNRRAYVEGVVSRRAKENPDGSWSLLFRPWVTGLMGSQFVAEDPSPVLSRLEAPLLLIRAEPSHSAVSDPGIEFWKRNKPEIEIRTITGSAHNVHGTRPREFVDTLLTFLRSVR